MTIITSELKGTPHAAHSPKPESVASATWLGLGLGLRLGLGLGLGWRARPIRGRRALAARASAAGARGDLATRL